MRLTHATVLGFVFALGCVPTTEKKDSTTAADDAADSGGEAGEETTGSTEGGTEGGTTGTTEGGTTGGTTGDDTVNTGQVALGFPEDLVVVSPYSTETAALAEEANAEQATIKSGNVAVLNLAEQAAPPRKQEDLKGFATKRAFLSALVRNVNTDDGCMFKPDKPRQRQALCYGPRIVYKDHPDGADGPNPSLPPNDLGFWLATEPVAGTSPVVNEPCMTAKTSEIVDEISRRIDNATGTAAMFLCFARRDKKSLPEAGKTLDLQPYADKAKAKLPADAPDFSGVSMSRVDVGGKPVYTTKFKLKEKFDSLPADAINHDVEIEIVHKPTGENNSSYTGYVKMLVSPAAVPTAPTKACVGNKREVAKNGYHAVSVAYQKVEEKQLSYEFRGGHFPYEPSNSNPQSLFDGGYAKIPGSGDCELGGELAIYDSDPSTGYAKLAYSWFAGSPSEQVRSLVSEVAVAGSGSSAKKQGCGYYGFGEPWTEVAAELASKNGNGRMTTMLTQFTCNWAGPGSMPSKAFVSRVQRQCAMQNAAGYFEPHTHPDYADYIAYSPQNDCVRAGGDTFKTCVQPENVNTCPGGGQPTQLTYTTGDPKNPLLDITSWSDDQKKALYSPALFKVTP